jgi:hypothetical protein
LWIRTEAEHAAFRQSAEIDFGPIWRARYPPSDNKYRSASGLEEEPEEEPEVHPPISADVPIDKRWCGLCNMWLRDKPQYDDHLINFKHRKNKKLRRLFCRQICEVARMFHADYESKQCARMWS